MNDQETSSDISSIVRSGIDSHQHFWKYDAVRDSWITDEMHVIQKDFLPGDLKPLLNKNNFEGCIAVQADQSEKETDFLLQLAKDDSLIKGIVGWVDLQSSDLNERLSYYKTFPKIKGFRHILQAEKDEAFMLKARFMKGIAALSNFDFSYDILVYSNQLKYVPEFVSHFPNQKFVLDHLGKPAIKDGLTNSWVKDIMSIAQHENVYCKLSGMVTEANWKDWNKEEFRPYLDVVVEAFGPDNIMFGSDWPVCLLSTSYEHTLQIITDYFSSFSIHEQDKVFRNNAVCFYNLD